MNHDIIVAREYTVKWMNTDFLANNIAVKFTIRNRKIFKFLEISCPKMIKSKYSIVLLNEKPVKQSHLNFGNDF